MSVKYDDALCNICPTFGNTGDIKPTANDKGRLLLSFMIPDRFNGKAQVSFDLAEEYRNNKDQL